MAVKSTPVLGTSAKVVYGLKCRNLKNNDDLYDAQDALSMASDLAKAIEVSPKFYLGEYMREIPAVRGCNKTVAELMPFDRFVLEYDSPTNVSKPMHNVCLVEWFDADSIAIKHFYVIGDSLVINWFGAHVRSYSGNIGFRPFKWFNNKGPDPDSYCMDVLEISLHLLLYMAEILECKNVGIKTISPSRAANAKRLKKGKLPLYEYKILTINDGVFVPGSRKRAGKGKPVRLHLRRGHIRHHPTAGKVWVRQCAVGHAENGVIRKDYRVKGGAA